MLEHRSYDGRSTPIQINAKPAPIQIDPNKTAVIVVDMQNDFGSRGGMFDRAGIDISGIRAVIEPTARVLDLARRAGMKVIYLKMGYEPDLSDLGTPDAPNRTRHMFLGVGETIYAPDGTESRILVRDNWGTDIVSDLEPQPGDIVLYKTRFSGFYQTALDKILRQQGVKYLVITGCTTSICVESTIRDAMFRDYSCVLLADCAAEPIGNDLPRTNHEASLLSIQTLLGWVSDSETLIAAVDAGTAAAAR